MTASFSIQLASHLFRLCALIVGLSGVGLAQNAAPVLLSQEGTTRAIALESVTHAKEPFSQFSEIRFGSDSRTRIAIFAKNAELFAGETVSAFTANVQDASGRIYPFAVENAVPLPRADGITMLIVRVNEDLGDVGDVLLGISLHGMSSNRVRIGIGHVGGGPPDPDPTTNQPPTVAVFASPTSGVTPLTVGFTSNASDPDGYISAYNWTFGDGQSSTQTAPSHVYQTAGSFSARLTVTDNAGATASAVVTINVTNPPTTGTRFKVLHWNVAYGRGTDNIIDHNRQATWMANMQVDLISLNEVPPGDVQRYVDLLRQKTGVTWYSHWVAITPGNSVGQQILSRYPLVSTSARYLSFGRSVTQVRVSIGGKTINFFSTHLSYESASWRATQISELKSWASGFSEQRIVAGDFNMWDGLSEYGSMTASYVDSWAQAMSLGTAVAYPDNPTGRTRGGRIDFIFYSRSAANLALIGVKMPDQRDLNNHNVVVKVGNSNDWGVRPSDHNFLVSTFEVR